MSTPAFAIENHEAAGGPKPRTASRPKAVEKEKPIERRMEKVGVPESVMAHFDEYKKVRQLDAEDLLADAQKAGGDAFARVMKAVFDKDEKFQAHLTKKKAEAK